MHAMRDAGDCRGAVKAARDKMHLRIQGVPKGKAADCKAAKSNLVFFFFHPVVRMEFLCVVAHLLHASKTHAAFPAFIQPLLVRHLLVLHQFLYFAKLFAARLAFVLFEKVQFLSPRAVLAVPALPAQIAFHVPLRLWVVKKHPEFAIAYYAKVHLFVVACVFFLVAFLADQRA